VNVVGFAHVKSGDVLLRIDQPRFEAALKTAQERLSLVQQQAKSATGQPMAQANILEAQAAVERARLELEQATIKAPVDGIVGKVLIRPGTVAEAGVSLFPIVDTSKWWVDANFKETDLARIHSGEKATIYVDAFPSHELAGEVEANQPGEHIRSVSASAGEHHRQLDKVDPAFPRARFAHTAAGRSGNAIGCLRVGDGRYYRQGLGQCGSVTALSQNAPSGHKRRLPFCSLS
jgi:multidrug resistance efflux pump